MLPRTCQAPSSRNEQRAYCQVQAQAGREGDEESQENHESWCAKWEATDDQRVFSTTPIVLDPRPDERPQTDLQLIHQLVLEDPQSMVIVVELFIC